MNKSLGFFLPASLTISSSKAKTPFAGKSPGLSSPPPAAINLCIGRIPENPHVLTAVEVLTANKIVYRAVARRREMVHILLKELFKSAGSEYPVAVSATLVHTRSLQDKGFNQR
jgi:hypothetical protein